MKRHEATACWKTAPAPAEPPTVWQAVHAAKKGEVVNLVTDGWVSGSYTSMRRAYFTEAVAHEDLDINQRVIVVVNREAPDAD